MEVMKEFFTNLFFTVIILIQVGLVIATFGSGDGNLEVNSFLILSGMLWVPIWLFKYVEWLRKN